MSKTALQSAMHSIGVADSWVIPPTKDKAPVIGGVIYSRDEIKSEGEKMLAEAEAAAKAEAFADIGANALFLREEAWREAQGLVNRAIERGGRDPRFPLASDTRAMRSIAELLISVQESKQEPSDEELLSAHKRGQEIAKNLNGGDK